MTTIFFSWSFTRAIGILLILTVSQSHCAIRCILNTLALTVRTRSLPARNAFAGKADDRVSLNSCVDDRHLQRVGRTNERPGPLYHSLHFRFGQGVFYEVVFHVIQNQSGIGSIDRRQGCALHVSSFLRW